MERIEIDLTHYLERYPGPPADGHLASWTFIIGDTPTTIFGPYDEATSTAKLYLRMSGHPSNRILLEERATLGRSPAS